jgi:hypothetical protein
MYCVKSPEKIHRTCNKYFRKVSPPPTPEKLRHRLLKKEERSVNTPFGKWKDTLAGCLWRELFSPDIEDKVKLRAPSCVL